MRLARFFTISLALHLGVLAYPMAFHGWKDAPLIAVTIMPMESDANGVRGDSEQVGSVNSTARRVKPIIKPADESVAVAKAASEAIPNPSPVEFSAKINQANVVLSGPTSVGEVTDADNSSGRAGPGAGGNGFGSMGAGSGSGSGTGAAQTGSLFTQARYSNTPKPVYPENARREGREGRVLLRVLIDDQGKTKFIEVNRSSGSDALDQAATEAIKLWRFHPARASDRTIESWVTIPIDFRLMDERN